MRGGGGGENNAPFRKMSLGGGGGIAGGVGGGVGGGICGGMSPKKYWLHGPSIRSSVGVASRQKSLLAKIDKRTRSVKSATIQAPQIAKKTALCRLHPQDVIWM